MKEKSVLFYKRLIIFTFLSIIIAVAGLLTFFIGQGLGLWSGESNEDQAVPAVSSDGSQKTTDSALIAKENEKNQESNEKTTYSAINGQRPEDNEKVVYLTFDDGSSKNTAEILGILNQNDIKATFFFNTSESQTPDSIIKEAYDSGHSIGVLTSTGYNYNQIYSSVDKYVEDLNKSYSRLYEITGENPTILRFPGGSINAFNKEIYKGLISEVKKKGLVYFDWNVCAQDGSRFTSKETIVLNATKLPFRKDKCMVLIHDNGNVNTPEALREIIAFYKQNGYVFLPLTADVEPIVF